MITLITIEIEVAHKYNTVDNWVRWKYYNGNGWKKK
jgi:hypothetical protein